MAAVECGYGAGAAGGSPWPTSLASLGGGVELEAWGRKLYPGGRMFLQDTLHQPRGPVSALKEEPLPARAWPVDNSRYVFYLSDFRTEGLRRLEVTSGGGSPNPNVNRTLNRVGGLL